MQVIDLTECDTDSESEMEDVDEGGNENVTEPRARIVKFTFRKRTRSSRLQLVRAGMAEKVHVSCFSKSSKKEYARLIDVSKETYVADSTNPFCGRGLFVIETVEAGEMICVYFGQRIPYEECIARMNGRIESNYMLELAGGVVIDGAGVNHGGAMANHSCAPNAILDEVALPGTDRAPVGIIRALRSLNRGDEVLVNYGMWNPRRDPIPDLNDLTKYVPCRCLAPNCCRILKLKN